MYTFTWQDISFPDLPSDEFCISGDMKSIFQVYFFLDRNGKKYTSTLTHNGRIIEPNRDGYTNIPWYNSLEK